MNTPALAFADAGFPIIPVRLYREGERWRKLPLLEWDLATTEPEKIEEWWQRWPSALPGIPLSRVGWAVVDIDSADGAGAVRALGCLGPHSSVATPSGGKHLVFAQPAVPVAKHLWCDGVEVLGTSSLLTAYDLEELLFPRVAPRAVLPKTFWGKREGEAQGKGNPKIKREEERAHASAVEVADVTAALWELDARDWNGGYPAWFAFATACRFLGIARAEFVRWCVTDPDYAADARLIERIWDSTKPVHAGAFWTACKERGIKVGAKVGAKSSSLYLGVPLASASSVAAETPLASASVTRDLRHRSAGLLAWLGRDPTEPTLFRVACVFGEIIAEGRIKVGVAQSLLIGAAQSNGLWRELGKEGCKRTIANGLRHVEEKFLETERN